MRQRARRDLYLREALGQAPRLLGLLDRHAHSPTYGLFDRDYWAWKFRDFPLGMLQTGVYPLALLWSLPAGDSPYAGAARLLDWIAGSLETTVGRQHRNGAFDVFCPNEQDPGATLGVTHALAETVGLLGEALPEETRTRVLAAIRRACGFSLDRDESHAFISNHQALFAVVFQRAGEWFDEPRFRLRAEEIVHRILAEQSEDGWYAEYGGPDPGYESHGIFHLAVYWRRTGEERVLRSLGRAVDFYSHCVHPDGSVGGVYGSRRTGSYYPAGLELLAGDVPRAGAVAGFMAERLSRGNVPLPSGADVQNLVPLTYSYLEAARAAGGSGPEAPPETLPCESLEGMRIFEEAGIAAVGTENLYAVVAGKAGGACRIFRRSDERLIHEDAGYLVRTGGRRWTTSRWHRSHTLERTSRRELVSRCSVREVQEEGLTPWRFMMLRALNLTAFRIPAFGSWIRRRIVRRLITAPRSGPVRLTRTIHFRPAAVDVRDELSAEGAASLSELRPSRDHAPFHMGSARYFRRSDLLSLPLFDRADPRVGGSGHPALSIEFTVPDEPAADPPSCGRVHEHAEIR